MVRGSDNNRVVVTGLGVVSSIGIGWQEFWKNLIVGKSGITKIESFDTSGYERHYGGEIKNFSAEEFMYRRRSKQMGRASQMAIAAGKLALDDAKINAELIDQKKVAVCVGTTTGEQGIIEDYNDYKTYGKSAQNYNKLMAAVFPSSSISSNVAIHLGFNSNNLVFSTACASGNYALAYGLELIRSGRADIVLAGGADGFSRLVFTGFSRLLAVAPEKCQPFDVNRKGMIPAEGAGILVIESLEHAKKRNALIYAEILGYGLSCDARHMTNPSIKGIIKAMKKALNDAGIQPKDIDYISAHGTGTLENDSAECRAILEVFGDRKENIPVSSIKSMLGHTMGAASSLESIVCCLSIKDQQVPPTINHSEFDYKCDINFISNKSQKIKIKTVMNNSQAFGGNNAVLIVNRIK